MLTRFLEDHFYFRARGELDYKLPEIVPTATKTVDAMHFGPADTLALERRYHLLGHSLLSAQPLIESPTGRLYGLGRH